MSKDKPQFNCDLLQNFKQPYVAKAGRKKVAESYSFQCFLLKLK